MRSIAAFLKGRHAMALVIVPVAAFVVAFFLWKTSLSLAPGDLWDRPATGPELIVLVGCATIMWCVASAMDWVERTSVRSLTVGYASIGLWICGCAAGLPLLMGWVLRSLPVEVIPDGDSVLIPQMPTRFQLPWPPFMGLSVTCVLCTGIALCVTGVVSRRGGPLCGLLTYLVVVVAQSHTFLRFLPGGYPGKTAAVEGSAPTVSTVAVVCAGACALLGVIGYAWGLAGGKSLRP
ncbi:hypothetical protein FYJ43_09870 [Cutibacterium sp. WCA-380-WT-3A]|uniref:Uncharacterized protein n=1 Tax=Cutibacterium porci TaxID=2605781 RepID=A0A7K0J8P6_9ACTN|nr:hypothetical protein [Cutibacterium porci]MSS46319.1 hypothetical protein [Cutibacterium porci]